MNSLFKKFSVLFIFIIGIMLFGLTNVNAKDSYTMYVDANGGIEGENFKSTIVLAEEETFAVNAYNADFLSAPEGKAFSTIEMINKDGEIEGYADSVLLWGADFCDGMTLKFYWGDAVTDIDITLEYPEVGVTTETPVDDGGYYSFDEQTNKPNIAVNAGFDVDVMSSYWVNKDSYEEEYQYYGEAFVGTFEAGNKYYALLELHNCSNKEYAFADASKLNITVNGEKASVFNVNSYGSSVSITVEVELASDEYVVKEGANQDVNNTEYATFRINADYNLFKDGGKVFVDDNLVDPENYISEEGSTIITLLASYVNTLSVGQHTLKVEFTDSKVATTTFTISKSEVIDKTSAIEIPNTNLDKPAAGDNIGLYVVMFLTLSLGLSGTVIFKNN